VNEARSERKAEDRERDFCTGRELSSSSESLSVVTLNEYRGESEENALYSRAAMLMDMNNLKEGCGTYVLLQEHSLGSYNLFYSCLFNA